MILSGKEIEKRIGKDIVIDPFNPKQLNPNSYNVKLHDKLMVYMVNDTGTLDMAKKQETVKFDIPPFGLTLLPGGLYLGRTYEYTETYDLVPMLEGRSSIGRLGISIHITAGFGDVGFKGYWTLEISCVKPVVIYPFVEIGQLIYHTIEGEYDNYKSNKYQNNYSIQPSMMWKEFNGENP